LLKNKTHLNQVLAIGILLIPVVIFLIPTEWIRNQHSICLFLNITGHECYGCGMTRAIFSAIHLRFSDAFHFNRLSPVVLPVLIYIWAKTIVSLLPGTTILNIHRKKKINQKQTIQL
jgi:hypothetical protein